MSSRTLLALPLFAGLVFLHPSRQETYTFKVDVRNVYVDAFVTRGDKVVTDLAPDNFIVLDNGVPQEIQVIDVELVPLSAMLALDISGSVSGKKLEHLRAAAHAFVDGLDAEDEAGLLTFTHRMLLRKGLDGNFEHLHRALDRTQGGGRTALNDSLFVSLKLLEKAEGRPLLLLFTDGLDSASWLDESELNEIVGASEAVIYAVGVQPTGAIYINNRLVQNLNSKESRFLERITKPSGGQVLYAQDTSNLKDVYLRILNEMETRYLLIYQPQGVAEDGWHKIEVKLKGTRSSDVRARSGYFVAPEKKW
jgi:VWFA-related protein